MPSLLDIADTSEPVEIRGVKLSVHGLTARNFIPIMARFASIRKLMAGMELNKIDEAALFEFAPDAVSAIIAAATSEPGNRDHNTDEFREKSEAKAELLSIDEQVALIGPIFRQTFPRGVRPFVEELQKLIADVESGMGQDIQSLRQSPPSPNGDGTKIDFGTPLPVG